MEVHSQAMQVRRKRLRGLGDDLRGSSMIERILDFGTAAKFKTVMTAANLWNAAPLDTPIAQLDLPQGSVFLNVVGVTYTVTGTFPNQTATANPGYWVRIRWNGSPTAIVKTKTYSQLMTQLAAAGVTLYDTNQFQSDGTTTNPAWSASNSKFGMIL